jgi:hypothetical protein
MVIQEIPYYVNVGHSATKYHIACNQDIRNRPMKVTMTKVNEMLKQTAKRQVGKFRI